MRRNPLHQEGGSLGPGVIHRLAVHESGIMRTCAGTRPYPL